MIGSAVDFLLDGANWGGPNGLGAQLVQQVLLTVTALLVAMVVGLPVALWLGHVGRGGTLAVNVSNIGRAVPVFAVLVILSVGPVGSGELGPYGRAGLATLVALVVFALPPLITNAYVGLRGVDPEIVEAARGMGMSERRLFARIEVPLARGVILNGVRQALVQVWATASIAALVAGPGLGRTIVAGFDNDRYDQVVAGCLLVAGGAIVLEALAVLVERAADPLRRARRTQAGHGPVTGVGEGVPAVEGSSAGRR